MSISREERDVIAARLVEQLGESPNTFSVARFASQEGLTPQSVYRYLARMETEGIIQKEKTGRKNMYSLVEQESLHAFALEGLSEDVVWKQTAELFFKDIPQIAKQNLSIAFTEMLNNAIDHSDGTAATVKLFKNGYMAKVYILDNGVGIFTKIADAMGLPEKSFAVLELAKGKFTTDPQSHTGEGVFFSSKLMDEFAIFSDELAFLGPTSTSDPYLDHRKISPQSSSGTAVIMSIKYNHTQTAKEVYDAYTEAPDDYGFSKTLVPVRLLEYGDEKPLVVSRSQAKRLMVRFERFENIVLDFSGIDEIGQGFADELFRVFPSQHPGTKLSPINCSEAVLRMISRVQQP